jgi:hypothetical protein
MEKHMHAFDQYEEVWREVRPLMKAKLERIKTGLSERIPHRLSEIYEGGDEESRLSLDVYRSDSLCVVSLDFTLLDATVNDEKLSGFGISLSITGYAALALGGYTPKAYTPEAFTDDVAEIVDRIEALDTADFVRHVCDEALAHEALLRELAQVG